MHTCVTEDDRLLSGDFPEHSPGWVLIHGLLLEQGAGRLCKTGTREF